jgi:hypothetical protein
LPFSDPPRPLPGAMSPPNLASWLRSSVLLRLSSFPTSSRNCKSCSTDIEPSFVLGIGYLSRRRNHHNDCATTTETRQTEQCQTSSHAGSGKGSYAGIYLSLVVVQRPQGGLSFERRYANTCSRAPSTASSRHGTRANQPMQVRSVLGSRCREHVPACDKSSFISECETACFA